MKNIIFMLLLCLPVVSMAQDVDVKNDKIVVDGKEYASITKEGCKMLVTDCYFNVNSLSGENEIMIMYREYKDWQERRSSNPNGRVLYYEFIFLKSKKKVEIAFMGIKTEKVAKAIVKAGLFKNGELDEAAVEKFELINGRKFSEKAGTN